MLQEVFRLQIGGHAIPIYGYGLMMVVGFLGAAYLARYLANRSGLDGEAFINAALLALFTGIIGARASHVLENLGEFTRGDRSILYNLGNMLNLRSGGLTYYGGFLLAFPTLVFYAIRKKITLRMGMDIVAPCLLIGLGFGRIGCFLNGCCFGAECDLPWKVSFPYHSYTYLDQVASGRLTPGQQVPSVLLGYKDGQPILRPAEELSRSQIWRETALPVHPAQIYSAITAFILAGLCLAYFTLPHTSGRVFALMMMLEGGTRYLLELLRVEPVRFWIGPYGLSLSMAIGLGLVALGLALWVVFGRLSRPRPLATTVSAGASQFAAEGERPSLRLIPPADAP